MGAFSNASNESNRRGHLVFRQRPARVRASWFYRGCEWQRTDSSVRKNRRRQALADHRFHRGGKPNRLSRPREDTPPIETLRNTREGGDSSRFDLVDDGTNLGDERHFLPAIPCDHQLHLTLGVLGSKTDATFLCHLKGRPSPF